MTSVCAPIPAKTADNQQIESDYNRLVSGFTSASSEMAKYRDLFFSVPGIADGMGYAALAEADRDSIWGAIDDRVQGVVELADPADTPANPKGTVSHPAVSLTRAEAIDWFACNVAHSLYHDVNDTFPWKLDSYDKEALKFLFDPARRMSNGIGDGDTGTEWDVDGGGPDYGRYIHETIEHSINQSYDIAAPIVATAGNPKKAIDLLLRATLGEAIHANATHTWRTIACTIDYTFSQALPYVSRAGCNSSGIILRSLCSSINIPCKIITGRVTTNTAHTAIAWPWFNLVMIHGDNHYEFSKQDGMAKGLNALQPYDEYETDVLSTAIASQASADAWLRMMTIYMTVPYPALYASSFSNPDRGWPYVEAQVSPALSLPAEQSLLDKMYTDLVQLTGDDGAYVAPEEGTLEIAVTAPVLLPWWTITPDPATGTGSYDFIGYYSEVVPAGSYTVEWWDNVAGSNPVPVSETKDVTDGATTTFGPCVYTPE